MSSSRPIKTTGPLVLGFDTSAPAVCVSLIKGAELLAHHREEMQRGQAETLMQVCQTLLNDSGHNVHDLDAVGVGVGPGNFTGIRISVAAARGLALGLSIPSVGVSAFDALRFGTKGPCACAADARRGQLFLQCFDAEGAGSEPEMVDGGLIPPHEGPLIGAMGKNPQYPRSVAIAFLSGERYTTITERPAPLYLRPADAAPARDTPPRIFS